MEQSVVVAVRAILIVGIVALGACSSDDAVSEGTQPGHCSDGADNDGDGLFDCKDPGCAGAPACNKDGSVAKADQGVKGDISSVQRETGVNPDKNAACNKTLCGSACVDLQTSAKHCGTCNHACPKDFTCAAGKCGAVFRAAVTPSTSTKPNCAGVCVASGSTLTCAKSCKENLSGKQTLLSFGGGTTAGVAQYKQSDGTKRSSTISDPSPSGNHCYAQPSNYLGLGSTKATLFAMDCCCAEK